MSALTEERIFFEKKIKFYQMRQKYADVFGLFIPKKQKKNLPFIYFVKILTNF